MSSMAREKKNHYRLKSYVLQEEEIARSGTTCSGRHHNLLGVWISFTDGREVR